MTEETMKKRRQVSGIFSRPTDNIILVKCKIISRFICGSSKI